MTSHRLLVAAAVIALTLLGYLQFPGHTYLQSDTQIYVPILERLWDPGLLGRDLVAREPHVSFTVYDEVALLLRRLTGLEFHQILAFQHVVFRALGILGVFLLAGALGLSTRPALLVAAWFSLGATVAGASVLVLEYEPVPRGFAVPLLLLALGLAARGRDVSAGIAAAAAFLYHPPTVYPFWIVYFCLTLWPTKPATMKLRIEGLLPLLGGVLLLFLFSRLQTAVGQPQDFFARIDAPLERLQRLRASYCWVSEWGPSWFGHYLFLWGASLVAFWRVRRFASQDLRFFLVGLPLVGMLSMPVSYLLLEKLKWSLLPQLQPMRALLFVTVLALILAAVAAAKAAEQRRYWETLLWLALAAAIPMHMRVLQMFWPDLSHPLIRRRVSLVLLLAVLGALALALGRLRRQWPAWAAWAPAVVLPFVLIPGYGQVKNYPDLHHPDLAALSQWARSSTPRDALFLFPDAGQQFDPGIFRASALRAVYVDWKAGGQVNFLKAFAREWYPRWQQTMAGRFQAKRVDAFAALGIDYVVLRAANQLPGRSPVYRNSRYLVYGLR
ncbi:MAG: hypothetical protein FJW34_00290 [Acidobacteria bacterium]|nr:hypothetical protein [Acidobacteriota bacterium]